MNQKLFASTSFIEDDSIRRIPVNEEEMLNVMAGDWSNGDAKYAFGTGVTGSASLITKYIYPNTTDPKVSQPWVDSNSTDTAGHRHGVGIIHYDLFKSKSYKRIDFAFVTVVGDSQVITKLQNDVDNAAAFYNQTLSHPELPKNKDNSVYPNPFVIGRDLAFYVDAKSVELMDGTGKLITTLENVDKNIKKFQIPCSEKLVPGVYYIKAVKSSSLSYSKVILINN